MAEVVCFPQRLNVGKARRVAAVYLAKATDRAKASYWGEICGRLEQSMRGCGFDTATIEREIVGFKSAVEQEMAVILDENSGGAA